MLQWRPGRLPVNRHSLLVAVAAVADAGLVVPRGGLLEVGRLEVVVEHLGLELPVGPHVVAGGQPEEVAATILWLASPAASYVTATTINCSGGR